MIWDMLPWQPAGPGLVPSSQGLSDCSYLQLPNVEKLAGMLDKAINNTINKNKRTSK